MKKFIIAGTLCAVALVGTVGTASAETTEASNTSRAEMMTKIQGLMKLIADLQAKLAQAKGEVAVLAKELSVGAEGSEVKEVQEILASDPMLFKAKPTGYFGPLTEEAIKKFQERYGLEVTGKIDEPTREVMRELKMEKKNGMIPPGLVKSDEVKQRIKDRLKEKWKDCDFERKFRASVCEKVKDKKHSSDDDMDDDDTPATREEATDMVRKAAAAVVAYAEEVDQMEEDDIDADKLSDARKVLMEARKKLADARRALAKKEYGDAVEKAEDAIDAINDEDDSDDDNDEEDEDEDEDDSDDDDEDDDDEDDD